MGIPRLTSYINKHKSAHFKDKTPVQNARLVFDGDALYFALIRRISSLLYVYGGDYDTIHEEFLKFFETLNNLNIEVYVVINGGNNIDMKKEYIQRRRMQKIEEISFLSSLVQDLKNSKKFDELPRPILSSRLLEEVLLEADVKHVTVEEEAAPYIASLANQLDAFAVTHNSDLFLSDVKQGVIILDMFFNSLDKHLEYFSYYNRKNFANYLEIDERLLPLLAVVLGNDRSVHRYTKEAQAVCGVPHRGDMAAKIKSIVQYLKYFDHNKNISERLEEILENISNGDRTIRQYFYKEIMFYDTEKFAESSLSYQQILEQPPKCMNNILEEDFENNLEYVKKLVIHGLIDSCVIDIVRYSTHNVGIQNESIQREASSEHSRELRRCLYTLLQPPKSVLEHTRKGIEYKKEIITINKSPDFTLKSLLESSVQVRQDFITDHLLWFPTHKKRLLFEVNSNATLFLLSVQYFVDQLNDSLKADVAKSLLLTFIVCQRNCADHRFEKLPPVDLDHLHSLCSFQSVLQYLMIINTLLGNPFQPIVMKRSLNGSKFQQIFSHVQQGGNYIQDYSIDEEDFELQLLIVASI